MQGITERYVTYVEYAQARLADETSSPQTVLMRLFEQKGILLKNDSWEPVPPVEITDDEEKQRFVIRQWRQ